MKNAFLDTLQSATIARYLTPIKRVSASSSSDAGVIGQSIKNFLFFDDPVFHKSAGKNFSLEARKTRMQDANVVMVTSNVSFPKQNLFDEAKEKSITRSADFSKNFLDGLDDVTIKAIHDKLRKSENDFKEIKTKFDEKYGQLVNLKSSLRTSAKDFRHSLAELNKLGHSFFTNKHKAEKEVITSIFSANGERATALKGNSHSELSENDQLKLDDEKKTRLKTLGKAQAEELKVYNDEMIRSVESAHNAHVAALEKVNFINMIKNNKGMMGVLKSILPNVAAKEPTIQPALYDNNEFTDEEIANIDLDKLQGTKGIKTETGLDIKVLGNGVYELNFPNHWLDKGYYLSGNNNVEADLKTILLAARLKGEVVTITFSEMTEEKANKAARAAFNSWASLGYDPSHLKVKISAKDEKGNPIIKTLKYNDIYSDTTEEHKAARTNLKEQMNVLTAADKKSADNNAAEPAQNKSR